MSGVDGAKGIKGEHVKPIDFSLRGSCPCDAFLRCSTRQPYGQNVWTKFKTRKLAKGAIAYDGEGPAADLNKYLEEFKNIEKYSTRSYNNKFYKNIQKLRDKAKRVLTLPPISGAELAAQMALLKGMIHNTGSYTDFQRSIILRANLVRNGIQLVSDVYEDGGGAEVYGEKQLTPYCGKHVDSEWNVDHIQTRAKGGCNRFCNAAVLARADNMEKSDQWQGCPCVDAFKGGGNKPHQAAFQFTGSPGGYTLFNCIAFSDSVKKKEDAEKRGNVQVEKLPSAPLGTINKYRELCNLDNPLKFNPKRSSQLTKKAEAICSSGR